MNTRFLLKHELPLIRQIDRSEVIHNIYYFRDGKLVLEPEFYDMKTWPPGELEKTLSKLEECYDRGGYFWGVFADDLLVAVAVLDNLFLSSRKDMVQLVFLHVSHNYRGKGLARQLFNLAARQARLLGASRMYISATPSEHTVNFYRSLGCVLAAEIDPELFAQEPEDIHLEYQISLG